MHLETIRVFLAYRFRLLFDAVGDRLRCCDELELVGACACDDVKTLARCIEESEADVVLLDASPGVAATDDLIRGLEARRRGLRIVPIGVASTSHVLRLIEAGACGYVRRDAPFTELVATVLSVQRGEARCSPEVAASVIARIVELSRGPRSARRSRRLPRGSRLTPREKQVLRLVATGLQNKEIAQRLDITLATVKNHVHKILDKLRAHRRREAIQLAYESGLLEDPVPLRTAGLVN